jgi:hypothetical protein
MGPVEGVLPGWVEVWGIVVEVESGAVDLEDSRSAVFEVDVVVVGSE